MTTKNTIIQDDLIASITRAVLFCNSILTDTDDDDDDDNDGELYAYDGEGSEIKYELDSASNEFIRNIASKFCELLKEKNMPMPKLDADQIGHKLGMSVSESGCGFFDVGLDAYDDICSEILQGKSIYIDLNEDDTLHIHAS